DLALLVRAAVRGAMDAGAPRRTLAAVARSVVSAAAFAAGAAARPAPAAAAAPEPNDKKKERRRRRRARLAARRAAAAAPLGPRLLPRVRRVRLAFLGMVFVEVLFTAADPLA
ncbi:unnamed protein product, partial [Prorocentrum cordatum]